jgi:CRISPR-associated protein Cas5
MEKIDISLLFKNPIMDKEVILTIEPLAPLSMVNTIPGSYYKTQKAPTKFNISGVFENVLGWHLSYNDRKRIVKKIKSIYKKQYKIGDFKPNISDVGYIPLLEHLFEIELPIYPVVEYYDDLWKQELKADDKRHLGGTPNIDYNLIKEKQILPKDSKGKVADKILSKFFKDNQSKFPQYYTSPTPREFIIVDGEYKYKLKMNNELYIKLKETINHSNISYLGTNEGWVNIKIEEL